MNNIEFTKEYLGEFSITKKDIYLYNLAEEYHKRTEEYDRLICSGPIRNGSVIPATSDEYRLINKNALRVLMELELRAYNDYCISTQELKKAIRDYMVLR